MQVTGSVSKRMRTRLSSSLTMAVMAGALVSSWDPEVLRHTLGIAEVLAGQILCPEDLGGAGS